MNYFSEMEWSTKWDWENFVASKKLQLADWTMVDDGEIDTGSVNLSGGGSSVKSPISASTDSSPKNRFQAPNLRFITFEGSSGNVSKNVETKDTEVSEISQPLKPSVGSMEPLIGLKLGKRTYFENGGTAGYVKSSSLSVRPIPSTTTQKKMKSSSRNAPIPFCQVQGCNIDLSTSKEYHRKHRVCDSHSKCPKVIVGGLERRFCQQCSRFHCLLDFDGKKRSCRSRLSDHNARRRKPQMKHIHFDSTSLSSPFFGGTQQLSSLLNGSPFIHSMGTPANSTWDSMCNSKVTLTKGVTLKSDGDGRTDEPVHMRDIKLSHIINMHANAATGLLASKSSTSEVVNLGTKGDSLISSHLDAGTPEYDHRALSLLSSSSWGSCGPESVPVHPHPMQLTQQFPVHVNANAIPEGVPLEFWPTGWHSTNLHAQLLPTNTNFQLFKTPCESMDFYSNL